MNQNDLIMIKSRNLKPVKFIGHFKYGDQRKRIAIGYYTKRFSTRKNERIVKGLFLQNIAHIILIKAKQ